MMFHVMTFHKTVLFYKSAKLYNHEESPANSDHLVRVKHKNIMNLIIINFLKNTATKLGYIQMYLCTYMHMFR